MKKLIIIFALFFYSDLFCAQARRSEFNMSDSIELINEYKILKNVLDSNILGRSQSENSLHKAKEKLQKLQRGLKDLNQEDREAIEQAGFSYEQINI